MSRHRINKKEANHRFRLHLHYHDVHQMPRILRIFHPKMRRHMAAHGLGFTLMFIGSNIATHATMILAIIPVPHAMLDMVAYGIHGIGLIPVAAHFEPVMKALAEPKKD